MKQTEKTYYKDVDDLSPLQKFYSELNKLDLTDEMSIYKLNSLAAELSQDAWTEGFKDAIDIYK